MPRIPQWRIPRPNSVRNDSEADESQADVEEEDEVSIKEPDPGIIEFSFLKTGTNSFFSEIKGTCKYIFLAGKSEDEGVLLTHGGNFKYHRHGPNRDGGTVWYVCSMKKSTGCQGRATVRRTLRDPEDPTTVNHVLAQVSTPEYHGHWHRPQRGTIFANKLLTEMKLEVQKDPTKSVGKFYIFRNIFFLMMMIM